MSGYNTKLPLDKQSRIDSGTIANFDGSIGIGEKFYINGIQIDVTGSDTDTVLGYDILTNKYRPISGTPGNNNVLGDNRIISGMEVTAISGDNLTFNVNNGIYIISGQSYTFSGSNISTNSGDTLYDRYDILYVSGTPNQNIVYISVGTPSSSPVINPVPINSVGVAIIKIPANTTNISGSTSIYPISSIFATQVIYNRGSINNISQFLDANYVYPTINYFDNNKINGTELGDTITGITFNWLTNKSGINNTLTSGGTFGTSINTFNLTGTSITADTSFNLSFFDGINTANSNSNIKFYNKIYFGNYSGSSITGSSQVIGLNSNINYLMTGNTYNKASISGNSNYIYICYPSHFGVLDIFVNNNYVNSFISNIISFTNTFGYSENYYILRSNYTQGGTNIKIELKN